MFRTALSAAALVCAALLAAPAQAGDWRIDQDASTVHFQASAFGNPFTGRFGEFSADITLDPDNLEDARIDATVSVGSASTDNSDYQSAIRSESGLAPDDYPQAHFVSRDIRAAATGYEAHGVLTLKGVESEIVLPFTLEVNGERAVADGAFTINRETFGVGGSDWGDVGDEVEVRLHIEAELAGDQSS